MTGLTIEEFAQRLDVHVPQSGVEIDYCHCGAIGEEGHTFACIMERMKRGPYSSASLPARGESDHG